MLKKPFFALITLLVTLTLLAASDVDRNTQKVYPIDTPVYHALKYLYIDQGLALPSTTEPWTEAELRLMLSRIEKGCLSGAASQIYSYVEEELQTEAKHDLGILKTDIGVYSDTDFRFHTNPADFPDADVWGGEGDWYIPAAFLRIPFEFWMGGASYAYLDLDILKNPRNIRFDSGHSAKDNYITTSIPFLTPHSRESWDLSMDFPYRAFGSIGGSWWNMTIGRDDLSWGPGESGNFTVGDQLPFHDNFRISTFSDTLKYTFSVSSFYHPTNYLNEDKDTLELGFRGSLTKDGLKLLIAHRVEWRPARKVNLALTESIIYQSETGAIDISVLNPLMILHNLYIRSNANSLLTFEADYTPVKHLNLYTQLAVDEFNINEDHGEKKPPVAIAAMLGAKTGFALNNGMLYGALEGVYTDPYLYLRDDGKYSKDKYGINFITAIPQFSGMNRYYLKPIGYRYGGDAVVGTVKAGYEKYGKWHTECSLTHIAHGCIDITTKWNKVSKGERPHGPTKTHPAGGSFLEGSNWAERNSVSHTTVLNLDGGYSVLKNLDIYGGITYIHIKNPGNIRETPSINDLQFTAGIRYEL